MFDDMRVISCVWTTSSGHAHDHVTGKEKAYKRLFLNLFAQTALLNDRNLIFYLLMHRFETFLENPIFAGTFEIFEIAIAS